MTLDLGTHPKTQARHMHTLKGCAYSVGFDIFKVLDSDGLQYSPEQCNQLRNTDMKFSFHPRFMAWPGCHLHGNAHRQSETKQQDASLRSVSHASTPAWPTPASPIIPLPRKAARVNGARGLQGAEDGCNNPTQISKRPKATGNQTKWKNQCSHCFASIRLNHYTSYSYQQSRRQHGHTRSPNQGAYVNASLSQSQMKRSK